MRVLGIDQSYTGSGLIVLESTNILHAERFTSSINLDKPDRCWEIATHIGSIVDNYNPHIIAIEGLAFGMRGDATRDLAGLQFVIICVLRHFHKKDTLIVSPKAIKKFATGSGKADKKQMIENLPPEVRAQFDNLGVKKTTGLADLTDAYFLARMIEEGNYCAVV